MYRPPPGQEWACAYVALMNLYAWAGLKPPPLDELLAWAASNLGRGKALAREPRTRAELEAAGLTRYDLKAVLLAFGFPLTLRLAELDDGRSMGDVLPGLLRGGCAAVLWLRLRYRGRVYGHACVAFDSSPGGIECLDFLCPHRRAVPWSFGLWDDLRGSLHSLRRGRPTRGHVARYGWETLPAGAPALVNGSRRAQPLGVERHFLLAR